MNRLFRVRFLWVLSLMLFINAHASDNKIKKNNTTDMTSRASTSLNSTKLNLNNISTWIHNNGGSDYTPSENSGMEFPRGSRKTAVYKSGLVWGARLNGNIHAGGSTYNHGLSRGRILPDGSAEDTNLVSTRIFRVRPDYKTADFSIEASEEMKTQQEIYFQYAKDWDEWPASDGAPYQDIDGDGKYDPEKDIPGMKNAVQTVWYAANDLNAEITTKLYGSQPMGIELQAAFWTYDKDFVLKNTYFGKYKIINKSRETFSDMYVSLWSDPDIGHLGDDLAGCDSTLNLGFAYNGHEPDVIYGYQVPAVGFDLLQGPVVKGTAGKDLNRNGIDDSQDTAFVNGKKNLQGYINLPMTAFYSFSMLSPELSDPVLGSYEGTYQIYNFLQGKIGKTGNYFKNPEGKNTTYMYPGDPGSGSGWLDGTSIAAGDRRTGVSSGPFTMAPGDTQEVAFAQIAAIGNNRLHSVHLLKEYDKRVKQHYNNSFIFNSVPVPEAPAVTAHYTKSGIHIDWQADSLIEKFSKDGFNFEGYNLYQLNNGIPDKKNGVKLAVFDLVNGINYIYGGETDSLTFETISKIQQHGTDRGIQRSYAALRDSIDRVPFIIGKKYYFGVSAYTYRMDPAGILTNSESPLRVVSVVFQDSLPGSKYMDTLKVFRTNGQSDKMITAVVYDPSKITGHDYEVGFHKTTGMLACYVKDLTLNKYLTYDISQHAPPTPAFHDPVFDGIMIGVHDAAPGMKDYKVISGTRKWTWANANSYFMEGFNGAIGYARDYWFTNSTVQPEDLTNTLIKFAATDSLGNIIDPNDPNASYAHRYIRLAQNPAARPEFQQHIKNTSGSYAYQDYTKSLPFAAYNEKGDRLMVGYVENNASGGRVDGKYWPPSAGEGIDNISATGPREWFFIFNVLYNEIPADELRMNVMQNTLPIMWFGTPNRTGSSNTAFSSNDQLQLLKHNTFTTRDQFQFSTIKTTAVETDNLPFRFELAQNYPNPFNPSTSIRFSLAERSAVSIKVFNILGQLVRVLADGEFNAGIHKLEFRGDNLASGIYIYRLDVKDKFTDVKKMIFLK